MTIIYLVRITEVTSFNLRVHFNVSPRLPLKEEARVRLRLRNIKEKTQRLDSEKATTRVHKVAKVKDCGRDWLESNFNNFLKWLLVIFVQKY